MEYWSIAKYQISSTKPGPRPEGGDSEGEITNKSQIPILNDQNRFGIFSHSSTPIELAIFPGNPTTGGTDLDQIKKPSYDGVFSLWCRRPDSNRHGSPHHPLKMACLPVSTTSARLWLTLSSLHQQPEWPAVSPASVRPPMARLAACSSQLREVGLASHLQSWPVP